MAVAAGADGCPGGWIVVWRDDRRDGVQHRCVRSARELVGTPRGADLMVVDIPIGLTAGAPRACDLAARRLLGRRGSSVFPAPIRPALDAASHRTAHERTRAARAAAGLPATGVSVQAFGIFAKVRDVDSVMTPARQERVREGHPELAFRLWAGRDLPAKRTRAGRDARRALVDAVFGAEAFARARAAYRVRDVAHDDLLDAFACLHVAERALRDAALVLPEGTTEHDERSLRMEILA